jgi:hypothetical protein
VGADVNAAASLYGQRALQAATRRKHKVVQEVLRKAGAIDL